jgi:mono/diheme cytochrome c family protein
MPVARIARFLVAASALFTAGPAPGAPREPATPRHAERVSASFAKPSLLRGTHALGFAPFADALRLVAEGRRVFRHDTFGDEVFWGDSLRLHEALAQTSPRSALALGLKVDADALPRKLAAALRAGRVDLDDPATTLALLRLNAVVGVTGFFDAAGRIVSAGTQCALCHSTVDDSLAPGVGHRLDGWANRDLDVGRIIAAAPDLSAFERLLGVDAAAVRAVLESWGPGKFDASLLLDGKAQRPDGGPAAVLIPPAFGLAGVNLHTWTGWGGVAHWNALVANLEMGGQGTFVDHRLDDADRFPIAAREGFGEIRRTPDQVTSKLPALHLYQLSLRAPRPPPGSFDRDAARRGQAVFEGNARCATCHVPPLYTEPGHNLHAPAEIGIDAFQAERSPTQAYRTAPLAGLWTHGKGGYYHDGRFPTLAAVIEHYDAFFGLGLSAEEEQDLVEFLKSL